MKPAWPMENWPVIPFTMLRVTAQDDVHPDDGCQVGKMERMAEQQLKSRPQHRGWREHRRPAASESGPSPYTFSAATRPNSPPA